MRRVVTTLLLGLALLFIITTSVIGVGAAVNLVFAPLVEFALRILTYS